MTERITHKKSLVSRILKLFSLTKPRLPPIWLIFRSVKIQLWPQLYIQFPRSFSVHSVPSYKERSYKEQLVEFNVTKEQTLVD